MVVQGDAHAAPLCTGDLFAARTDPLTCPSSSRSVAPKCTCTCTCTRACPECVVLRPALGQQPAQPTLGRQPAQPTDHGPDASDFSVAPPMPLGVVPTDEPMMASPHPTPLSTARSSCPAAS